MDKLKSKAMSSTGTGIRGLGRISKVILEGIVFLLVLTLVFLFIPAAVFSSTEDEVRYWNEMTTLIILFFSLLVCLFSKSLCKFLHYISLNSNCLNYFLSNGNNDTQYLLWNFIFCLFKFLKNKMCSFKEIFLKGKIDLYLIDNFWH